MTEFKVVVVGTGGVGKSAIVTQLMQNQFSEEYDPTIEDSYRKQLTVDNVIYLLDILDTAGQEEYSSMRDQYMRQGHGFLVIFALDNTYSFKEAAKFVQLIRNTKIDDNCPILLVGNKSDLKQVVEVDEIEKYKKEFNLEYIACSARNRSFIDETFFKIVRLIRNKNNETVKKKEKSKKSGCTIL